MRKATRSALQELDLTIQRGEFIALLAFRLGQIDGAQLHRRLAAIERRRHLADDKCIDVLPPEKRGFGMVFQNYAVSAYERAR
jgi:putative spermidine/putrescine transport system ATP-binding protein